MKPRHSKPDANQYEIEIQLQQCGFWTYRTANDIQRTNPITKNEFHPLDLLVIGRSRLTNTVEITLWEIKADDKASFTEPEERFIESVRTWFRVGSEDISPVGIAIDAQDILRWYGWVDK